MRPSKTATRVALVLTLTLAGFFVTASPANATVPAGVYGCVDHTAWDVSMNSKPIKLCLHADGSGRWKGSVQWFGTTTSYSGTVILRQGAYCQTPLSTGNAGFTSYLETDYTDGWKTYWSLGTYCVWFRYGDLPAPWGGQATAMATFNVT